MPPLPPKVSMGQFLKDKGITPPGTKRSEPLWKGPEVEGITFSMLSRFLVCRERFRLYAIEGLQSREGFNVKMGYGNMWHVCEQAYASERAYFGEEVGTTLCEDNLKDYTKEQCKLYPTQQELIVKWYEICKIQFPEYKKYWAKWKDTRKLKNIEAEKVFRVPYKLPSGRVVKLLGKRDSVDVIDDSAIWLMENKSKSEVNEVALKRQLKFDLQTMMYLVSLYIDSTALKDYPGKPVAGVRYNVIRRPLSGGKGSIKQHEATAGSKCPKCQGVPGFTHCSKCTGIGRINGKPAETKEHFYSRLRDDYIAKEPETYFYRWEVPVSIEDVKTFRRTCLDPILEQLCTWYEWITAKDPAPEEYGYGLHWRHPFGVYNVLLEGGSSDTDEYLATGSEVGLQRVDKLFPELET